MNTNQFRIAVLCLIVFCSGASGVCAKSTQQPNILFIVVDDLKPALGCYGDKVAITPNIDRLAATGVVFDKAYCQQAICGPSRASFLTGMRPDRTKVWDLKTKMRDVNPEIITIPQFFRESGYETAGIGKIFDSRCVDRGLDTPSWSIPFYTKAEDYYSKATGKPRSYWQDPETLRKREIAAREAKEKGLSRVEASRYERRTSSPSTECLDVPDNTYPDGAHVLRALDVMAELSEGDKPFLLAVGLHKPHLPFAAPKKYWDLYKRENMPLAEFRGNAEGAPMIAFQNGGEIRNYADVAALGSYSRDFGGLKLPEDKQRELIHGYYACVSYADALIGQLLEKLESLKLSDNTIVALVGDHGWHLGDNNLWCKHSNFEQAVRSPLIISAPGINASKTGAPVEFVDIFPTLTDLAGLKAPDEVDGKSLVPTLKDPKARVQNFAISQYPRGSKSGRVMGYSLRTEDYRYTIWMEKDWVSTDPFDQKLQIAGELYDYKKDPLETRNLINNPEYAKVTKDLRDKMLAFFKSQTER